MLGICDFCAIQGRKLPSCWTCSLAQAVKEERRLAEEEEKAAAAAHQAKHCAEQRVEHRSLTDYLKDAGRLNVILLSRNEIIGVHHATHACLEVAVLLLQNLA